MWNKIKCLFASHNWKRTHSYIEDDPETEYGFPRLECVRCQKEWVLYRDR